MSPSQIVMSTAKWHWPCPRVLRRAMVICRSHDV